MRVLELAIRAALLKLGGRFLEQTFRLDNGHRGQWLDCGAGHQAEFVSYRHKSIDTVLGPVDLRRAYYHCSECEAGFCPRDQELGVAGESLSPGLQRMICRTGNSEPFAAARRDLSELAGVELTTKRIERASEAIGEAVRLQAEANAEAVLRAAVLPIERGASIPKLYVTLDGTGVPTVSKENQGRAGKGPDGRAHTREVKLGCVFTQTQLDKDGNPQRDPESSTYAFSVEGVERFGRLLYAEARGRGAERAEQVIAIGDGAPWIWNLVEEHFPRAIQIVDYFHALQRLNPLLDQILAAGGLEEPGAWRAARREEFESGAVNELLLALTESPAAKDNGEIRKSIAYFDNNRDRIRYGDFRAQGLFVGSGVVEAGCKTIVHHRLKQSGMRWTVRGARAIISLRCQESSGRWEQIWPWLNSQMNAA